jgi:NADPH:quinone reductase-like Zn-dependent oxidoreductase
MSLSTAFSPPEMMKACQAKDYGDIDQMLSVEEKVIYPSLKDLPEKTQKNTMIIRTRAVATACSDCRMLSGLTRKLQGPPSFPYIPGGDCSGEVVEIPTNNPNFPFKVGDKVAARFLAFSRDALAEYAMVRQEVCDKIPEGLSFVDAAALASACPATLLAERIQPGERVLILGAGGGVGSLTSQIMRERGAAFIAGASQQSPERLAKYGYEKIVDYTKEDPFANKEFQDKPFDVVVDLAGAGAWLKIIQNSKTGVPAIVKPASQGGRYVTLTPDSAIFALPSISTALNLFLWIPLWRAIKSRLWCRSSLPKYTYAMCLDEERTHLTRTLEMAKAGKIQAVVDDRGPHSFTTEGVRAAFRVQESRHALGKVVIQVSQE